MMRVAAWILIAVSVGILLPQTGESDHLVLTFQYYVDNYFI